MGDSETIVIPYEMKDCRVRVLAPHCKQYLEYDWSSCVSFDPIDETLKIAKMLPLPASIMQRIENSSWRIETKHDRFWFMDQEESDRKAGERKVQEGVNCLKKCEYEFVNCHPHMEYLLTKVLTPDDFTFEQKLALFEHYSAKVIKWMEEGYVRNLRIRMLKGLKIDFPYHIVSEYCTLGEWKDGRRERVESGLKRWLEAQTAIRDMGGYDWHPLDFIFGDHLPKLVQLKTAMLQAELKLSYDTVMREYRDFLDAVEKASRLGAMRENTMQLDSILLGKYQVRISIRDLGNGVVALNTTKKAVRETVGCGAIAAAFCAVLACPVILVALPIAAILTGGFGGDRERERKRRRW